MGVTRSCIRRHASRCRVRCAEPEAFTDVIVRGTLNVLLAARERRATVVFASSSSVLGGLEVLPFREDAERASSRSPYAATKLAGGEPSAFVVALVRASRRSPSAISTCTARARTR